jgi:TolB-like protein/Flp pilus assembly protein TadD
MQPPLSAYSGSDPYVFVCYAHADADSVYPELQRLHESGFNIWFDEGIEPGIDWTERLGSAINSASRLLYFVSERSVDSLYCRNEVNFALTHDIPIGVIYLEQVELPNGLELSLGTNQAIHRYALSKTVYQQKLDQLLRGEAAPPVPTRPRKSAFGRSSLKSLAVVFCLLAFIGLAYLAFREEPTPPPNEPSNAEPEKVVTSVPLHNSIAVLPLLNLTGNPDEDYMSEGISDEILNQLSRVAGLKVIARTSSFRYGGGVADIAEIANKLHVTYVLEGSLRRSGDLLRISTQLVDTSEGVNVWVERYDRPVSELFDVQDEIAQAVVDQLRLNLIVDKLKPTQFSDAHDAFLRGWDVYNDEQPEEALAFFIRALSIDPDYAKASAAIALSWHRLSGNSYGTRDVEETLPKVFQYGQRALELDPDSDLAHTAMCAANAMNKNWWEAEKHCLLALNLNPGGTANLMEYALILTYTGRVKEALQYQQQRAVLDPENTHFNLGQAYYYDGQYEKAMTVWRAGLQLHPERSFLNTYLAFGSNALGDLVGSIEYMKVWSFADLRLSDTEASHFRQVLQDDGEAAFRNDYLGWLLNKRKQGARSSYLDLVIAIAYADIGDVDNAVKELEGQRQLFVGGASFNRLRSSQRWIEFLNDRDLGAASIKDLRARSTEFQQEIGYIEPWQNHSGKRQVGESD